MDVGGLLAAARRRGEDTMTGVVIPPGLDHFTMYVGLIHSSLELAKLKQTEARDLMVIGNHYEIESARIQAAFREVEAAMMADFQRDESLKDKNFQAITMLIAAGQYELASEFHKRFMESLKRSSLEVLLEGRNAGAAASNTRLRIR
jgi:hypothetical protein